MLYLTDQGKGQNIIDALHAGAEYRKDWQIRELKDD
jgi:hypothetical protein